MFDWIELIVNGLLTIVFGIIGVIQWNKEMKPNLELHILPVYNWGTYPEDKEQKVLQRKGFDLEIVNNSNRNIYDVSIDLLDKDKWCKIKGSDGEIKDLDGYITILGQGITTDIVSNQSFKIFLMGNCGIDYDGSDYLIFNIKYKYGWRLFTHEKQIRINRRYLNTMELQQRDFK